jgi:3'-phosphoadenosine 5'-phosphosulfate sulfotransferase (PAPS reductase)/FAD synthetase
MTTPLERLAGRRVVASISGGKDSAALSLHLRELGIEHERVFMDTGWEHPKTYEYLRGELTRVLGPITEIRSDLLMPDLIRKKGMFPQRTRRFCTEELKIKPMQRYLAGLGADVVNVVGIRRAESEARSKMAEWEWSNGFDCETWRPLVDWTETEVIAIHARHGLLPNPLYLEGASRVGCWPCIFARKAEVRRVADTDPDRIALIRSLEEETGKAAAARARAKGEPGRNPPSFFQAPLRGPAGARPCTPIDEVVLWSRTDHGGRQFELFEAGPSEEGCMRWGLCDTNGAKESPNAVDRDRQVRPAAAPARRPPLHSPAARPSHVDAPRLDADPVPPPAQRS